MASESIPKTQDRQAWIQQSDPEIPIFYTECRPLSNEPKGTILLIHGFPETSYQFRQVIVPLALSRPWLFLQASQWLYQRCFSLRRGKTYGTALALRLPIPNRYRRNTRHRQRKALPQNTSMTAWLRTKPHFPTRLLISTRCNIRLLGRFMLLLLLIGCLRKMRR